MLSGFLHIRVVTFFFVSAGLFLHAVHDPSYTSVYLVPIYLYIYCGAERCVFGSVQLLVVVEAPST
jgi:hypothetical protein